MKKVLLITLGTVSLTIGIIGIVEPGLPTTSFLLITAACYARSSERLYAWLLNHRVFGKYIIQYRVHRAMPAKAKVIALIMMWTSIISSCLFFIKNKYVLAIVVSGGIIGTIIIMMIKTLKIPNEADLIVKEELAERL